MYGISIVLHHVTQGLFSFMPEGLPMGATALCFNVPLLLFGHEKTRFGVRAENNCDFCLDIHFLQIVFHICLLISHWLRMTVLLLAFTVVQILGLGVTCVFRAQSTSAGTDVLARVIALNSNLKVSNMIIVIDSTVVMLGLLVFQDWAVPLYSWFAIFVFGKVVEMFQTENPNRAVFIVSQKTQEVKELIVGKMGMRGTFLHGRGMYEGKEKEIIFTIAERKDLPRLKDEVKEIDPNAFISTMHASKDSPRPGM